MSSINSVTPNPNRPTAWRASWESFKECHGCWWEQRASIGEPVYFLEDDVRVELCDSRPRRTARGHQRRRLLTEDEEHAERAFLSTCRRFDLVGVTDYGSPIRYPFLNEALVDWRPGDEPEGDVWISMFRGVHRRRVAICQSQMVHTSWLIQQPEYWEGLTMLRNRWSRMQTEVAFDEVSGRIAPLAGLAHEARSGNIPDAQVARFHEDLWLFARQWSVSAWVTWHLPLPEFPLDRVPCRMIPQFRGDDTAEAAYPAFIPHERLHGEGEVIWHWNSQGFPDHLRSSGATNTQCNNRELTTYFSVMRLFLAELALRSRFRSALPIGAIGRLVAGMARSLEKSEEHIKRMRRKVPQVD